MSTNQENIITNIENQLELSGLNYNESIMKLALAAGVAAGDFNSMFIGLLKIATGDDSNNINYLLASYANLFFNGNVNSINDFTLATNIYSFDDNLSSFYSFDDSLTTLRKLEDA